jgi:hypothetical protein
MVKDSLNSLLVKYSLRLSTGKKLFMAAYSWIYLAMNECCGNAMDFNNSSSELRVSLSLGNRSLEQISAALSSSLLLQFHAPYFVATENDTHCLSERDSLGGGSVIVIVDIDPAQSR